jgi:hypothetical protein
MGYGGGVAAKYSFQKSSPQNLGNKGLTGVFCSFWSFFLTLEEIGFLEKRDKGPGLKARFSAPFIQRAEALCSLRKRSPLDAFTSARSCWELLHGTIVRRGMVIICKAGIRGQGSEIKRPSIEGSAVPGLKIQTWGTQVLCPISIVESWAARQLGDFA